MYKGRGNLSPSLCRCLRYQEVLKTRRWADETNYRDLHRD